MPKTQRDTRIPRAEHDKIVARSNRAKENAFNKKKRMAYLDHKRIFDITSDFAKIIPDEFFSYMDENNHLQALLPFQKALIKRMISIESPIIPAASPTQSSYSSNQENKLNLLNMSGDDTINMFLRISMLILRKGCCKAIILIKMMEMVNRLYQKTWIETIEGNQSKRSFYLTTTRQSDCVILMRNEHPGNQYHLMPCTIVITNNTKQWKRLISQQKSEYLSATIFDPSECKDAQIYHQLMDPSCVLLVQTSDYNKVQSYCQSFYQSTILVPFRIIFDDQNVVSDHYLHGRFIWVIGNDDNTYNQNRIIKRGIMKELNKEIEANYFYCTVSMNFKEIDQEILDSMSNNAKESELIVTKVKDRLDFKAFNARYVNESQTDVVLESAAQLKTLFQLGCTRIKHEESNQPMSIKLLRGQLIMAEERGEIEKCKRIENQIQQLDEKQYNECPICFNEVHKYKVELGCCKQFMCVTCINRQIHERLTTTNNIDVHVANTITCPFCRHKLFENMGRPPLYLRMHQKTIEAINPVEITMNPHDLIEHLVTKYHNKRLLFIANNSNDKYFIFIKNTYPQSKVMRWGGRNEMLLDDSCIALSTANFPSSGYIVSKSFDVIILLPSYQLTFNMRGLLYYFPYNCSKKTIYQMVY